MTTWTDALTKAPIIPALRGLTSHDAVSVADTLCELGATVLEVPLRTKNPAFSDVEQEAVKALSIILEQRPQVFVAAGTVMRKSDIDLLSDLGVKLCLSLSLSPSIVEYSASKGIEMIPGVETMTEVIEASRAGAAGLKLFPATIKEPNGGQSVRLTPGFVSYLARFVSLPLIPAGNAFGDGLAKSYLECGAKAVNVGAQLFEPGIELHVLRERYLSLSSQWA